MGRGRSPRTIKPTRAVKHIRVSIKTTYVDAICNLMAIFAPKDTWLNCRMRGMKMQFSWPWGQKCTKVFDSVKKCRRFAILHLRPIKLNSRTIKWISRTIKWISEPIKWFKSNKVIFYCPVLVITRSNKAKICHQNLYFTVK